MFKEGHGERNGVRWVACLEEKAGTFIPTFYVNGVRIQGADMTLDKAFVLAKKYNDKIHKSAGNQ